MDANEKFLTLGNKAGKCDANYQKELCSKGDIHAKFYLNPLFGSTSVPLMSFPLMLIRGDRFFLPRRTYLDNMRSLDYSGVKLWNNLPLDTRQAESPMAFKQKMKQFLLQAEESSINKISWRTI